MALESCSLESSGRLLESVSNGRSRWMVIVSQETQDPAYRVTLLQIRRGGTKSRLVSLFLLESFLTKLISN
jgi:hypothetical protein